MQGKEKIIAGTKPLSRQEEIGFSSECPWVGSVRIYGRDINLRQKLGGPVGGALTHYVHCRSFIVRTLVYNRALWLQQPLPLYPFPLCEKSFLLLLLSLCMFACTKLQLFIFPE